MIIPDTCDLCGSPTKEGDYGQSWWVCINQDCSKSDPDWMFSERKKPLTEAIESINLKMMQLSDFKVDGLNSATIKLHESRWIGQGSGIILLEDTGTEIRFYFEDEQVIYLTNDKWLLELLKDSSIDARLKTMWALKLQKDSLLG